MKKLSVNQLLSLGLVGQILLVKLISVFPNFIERFYANGLFIGISRVLRFLFGWIPFSIGDLLYGVLIILLIRGIFKLIKNKFRDWKSILFRLGAYLSVFYFLFHILWGLNYYRNSLFVRFDLDTTPYSTEQLLELNKDLLAKVKTNHANLSIHDTLPVTISLTKNEILEQTQVGYDALAKKYPQFKYPVQSMKKSLFRLPLSYMGFAGYLNPITNEAQVNSLAPKINLPITSSHEAAHQIGIAFESEANFVGYMATVNHPDEQFNYSGNLMAMRYAISALAYKDSIAAKALITQIPKGVIKNIKESEVFWQSYQNQLEPFFKLFYHNYLKANQQKSGMLSYSHFVNILVAYREKYGLPSSLHSE